MPRDAAQPATACHADPNNDRAPAPWARRGPYKVTMSQIYDSMNKASVVRPTLIAVRAAVAAPVGDRLIGYAGVIRTIGDALR